MQLKEKKRREKEEQRLLKAIDKDKEKKDTEKMQAKAKVCLQ